MNRHLEPQALEAALDAARRENESLRQELRSLSERESLLENKLSLDAKTGLPTHYRLSQDLESLLRTLNAQPETKNLTVLLLQLDNTILFLQRSMKASLHEWVLYQLGTRFRECLGPEDRMYHTRDREFAFLLFSENAGELKARVKSLFERLREPFHFNGFNTTLDGSAGAALYPEHGLEKSALLHHADTALAAAVEQHKHFLVFKNEMVDRVVEKMDLQNSIIRAIEAPAMEQLGHQFSLAFQPKIFARHVAGRRVFIDRLEAETLIRWNHPKRGQVPPSRFIPLAEETGLILPLGKWILYKTVEQLEAWRSAGMDTLNLSVNLSARQFKSDDMVDILKKLIKGRNLRPGSLIIELTETSVFEDPLEAQDLMRQFKELGVHISVDDFGTGYSSLSYLHRFPLDEIKIDKLFTENLTQRPLDKAIIRSITRLAQDLSLGVIAEGVERVEEMKTLWDLGCKGYQGYLFSKPLSAPDFAAYWQTLAAQDWVLDLPQ